MTDSTQLRPRLYKDSEFPVWDGKRWWTEREVIEDVLRSVPEGRF